MRVTVDDSGLCCCTCVMHFEHLLTLLFVDFDNMLFGYNLLCQSFACEKKIVYYDPFAICCRPSNEVMQKRIHV